MCSQSYGVAALGNIATHPDLRNRGLGTAVTTKLCNVLLRSVETIGLNVKADNLAALSCYKKLGFKEIATIEQYMVEAR